jgi:hypothetical protein
MKNSLRCLLMIVLCFVCTHSFAQAFQKKDILLSFGLGMTNDLFIVGTQDNNKLPTQHVYFNVLKPQFNFKAEFAVSKYWGVGFITSVNALKNVDDYHTGYYSNPVNVQLGLLVNYHFYQLIADKLGRNPKLHADKWDIYTGFTIGNNLHIDRGPDGRPRYQNYPFMGYHVGARYYINEHLSVYGELGIGQSYFNIGLAYKFGGPKKKKIPINF